MFTPPKHATCHMSRVTCHMSRVRFFFFDKEVKLIGGGSVINRAFPVSIILWQWKRITHQVNEQMTALCAKETSHISCCNCLLLKHHTMSDIIPAAATACDSMWQHVLWNTWLDDTYSSWTTSVWLQLWSVSKTQVDYMFKKKIRPNWCLLRQYSLTS